MFYRIYHKIRYFRITYLWWKIKNAVKYAKIGYSMHCECCYYHIWALMRERFEQMRPKFGPESPYNNRPEVYKKLSIAIKLLKRMEEDDYFSDPDNHRILLSRKETVRNSFSGQQRDWEYLCDMLKKHMLCWWY